MADAVERLDHLVPVEIAPRSNRRQGFLSDPRKHLVDGFLVDEVVRQLAAVLVDRDRDQRLVALGHEVAGRFGSSSVHDSISVARTGNTHRTPAAATVPRWPTPRA